VGPVWRQGGSDEEILLAACYKNCLGLAIKKRLKTVAFPSISTGAFGFPIAKAAAVVLFEVKEFCSMSDMFDRIVLVMYTESDLEVYRQRYKQVFSI